jgi:hypothetical protein
MLKSPREERWPGIVCAWSGNAAPAPPRSAVSVAFSCEKPGVLSTRTGLVGLDDGRNQDHRRKPCARRPMFAAVMALYVERMYVSHLRSP